MIKNFSFFQMARFMVDCILLITYGTDVLLSNFFHKEW